MLAVLFEVTERLITWLKERVKARNNISDIPIPRNVLQCSRLAKVTLEWTSIHVTYRKHRIQIIVMKTIPWNIRNGLRVHEKLDEHKANEAKRFINFQFQTESRETQEGLCMDTIFSFRSPLRWGSAFSHDMKMYRTSQLKNGPSKAKMWRVCF